MNNPAAPTSERLHSLDLFRGLTMFLLVAEGTLLYSSSLQLVTPGSFRHALLMQFHHHPWNGLRFWDLVQPYFMFIVGVPMTFSIAARCRRDDSWKEITRHILVRCLILFFLGVILHCGYAGRLVWELWNVLTQLSFTILVAFIVYRMRARTQMAVSIGLLVLTELLYRTVLFEGFDQPFVEGRNFGAWMDTVLMGKINGDGWVAINCLPTAAHTIWGVLAGKLLMSSRDELDKIKRLAAYGAIGLLVGYGMDWASITPIIKRIATSSFTIASGGWCLVTLAACYWAIDRRGWRRWTDVFAIVGMNSIFIYMFSQTLGKQWFNGFVGIFAVGVLEGLGVTTGVAALGNSLVVLGLEWTLCYWLYRRRIFIKI